MRSFFLHFVMGGQLMYQALYRKWRPKTFSDVVGQAHITQTLQTQVVDGNVGHAYLFTGTRGTGKTTCARILAKAVNCLHPVDGAPCNECEACRGIDNGTLLDVTELDAASNNGVDQVRALRDEAVYTPAVLKRRVYIIDEVHMLSTAAFNALLKILEEPPEHLLFILATTELHKVPATILSRCQRFSFKRITPSDIEAQLLRVAEAEKIDLQADGAELLSRMANGALRDALSLLDQCRAITGPIGSREVLDLMGLAGNVQTAQLMSLILQHDAKAALLLFNQLFQNGKAVDALLGELSDLSRDLMILATAPEGGAALLTGAYDRKTLQSLGHNIEPSRFLYFTSTLQATSAGLGNSLRPRTDGELCLLRLCDETLCGGDPRALEARVARLERAVQRGGIPAAAPTQASEPVKKPEQPPAKKTASPAQQPPWEEERPPLPDEAPPLPEESVFTPPQEPAIPHAAVPKEPAPQAPVTAPKAAAPVAEEKPAADGSGVGWGSLLDQYKGRLRVDKRVFLNMAAGVIDGDVLTVYCQNDFVKTSLNENSVMEVLRDVTSQSVGQPVRVILTVGAPPVGAAVKSPQKSNFDKLLQKSGQFDNFKVK
jgi:DNA polymerase-3 subunit gamma/tau